MSAISWQNSPVNLSALILKSSSFGIFLASLKFFFSIDSTEYLSSFFEKIDEIGFLEFESDLSKFDEHPFAVANKNITHIIVNNFFSITF